MTVTHTPTPTASPQPVFQSLEAFVRASGTSSKVQVPSNLIQAARALAVKPGQSPAAQQTQAINPAQQETSAWHAAQEILQDIQQLRGTAADNHFVHAMIWHVTDLWNHQHWPAILALAGNYKLITSGWTTARRGFGHELAEVYHHLINEIGPEPREGENNNLTKLRRQAWGAMVRIDPEGMFTVQAHWQHHKDVLRLRAGRCTSWETTRIATAELFDALHTPAWEDKSGIDSRINRAIDDGADIHGRDQHGDRPLHAAVRARQLPGVLELLIWRCAKINAVNGLGETALLMAARARANDLVGVLVRHGADATIADRGGVCTFEVMPLHVLKRLKNRKAA